MKLKIILVIVAFLAIGSIVVLVTVSNKDNAGSAGLIYGPEYAYNVSAPEGWVIDNVSGKELGLPAVFHKEDETWDNAKSIMYTAVYTKDEIRPDLASVIEYDVNQFKKFYPTMEFVDKMDIQTIDKSGAVAKIKYQFNDYKKRYQAVAYIDAKKVVVTIVLDSKDKASFELSVPAFNELVGSYSFFTDKVIAK